MDIFKWPLEFFFYNRRQMKCSLLILASLCIYLAFPDLLSNKKRKNKKLWILCFILLGSKNTK